MPHFLFRDIFWKNHIRALVKEFQNFINYALKAMPAHAEFLLSLEALISVKFPEDSYLPPVSVFPGLCIQL